MLSCIPPGEAISICTKGFGWSPTQAAARLELSLEDYEDLINGKLKLTPKIANQIVETYGGNQLFWLDLEDSYREVLLTYNTWDYNLRIDYNNLYYAEDDPLKSLQYEEEYVMRIIRNQVKALKMARYDDLVLELIWSTDFKNHSAKTLVLMAQELMKGEPTFKKELVDFLNKIPTLELNTMDLKLYGFILDFVKTVLKR